MESESISVIVPVYNIKQYLPRCLECIANQTYHNLEIILVDDGSTDGSDLLCEEFAAMDHRTRVIHQPNMGLWAARNAGMEASNSNYLFFPDGDDYFHKDILRLLYFAINTDSQIDLAIAREKRTKNISEDITSPIEPKIKDQSKDDLIKGLFARDEDRYYVYMWNKLYRRSLVRSFQSRNYVRSQDYDFNMRVFLNVRKAVLIDNDLYFWVDRQDSLTHDPKSIMWMLSCRSRSLYRNYCEMYYKEKKYQYLVLSQLYRKMILWKAKSLNNAGQLDVIRECREYERNVRNDFMFCKGIPFYEKLVCLLLFKMPRLSRWGLKLTNNL